MATSFSSLISKPAIPSESETRKLVDRHVVDVSRKTSLSVRCRFDSYNKRSYPGYSSRNTGAGAASNVQVEVAIPTSVPVRVAYELLQAGHRYLDVRTPEEFITGRIPGSVNIPYMFQVGSGMTVNPKFLEQVSSRFGKDDELLIGCHGEQRSLMAANVLQSAGYTGIVDVAGGYIAWSEGDLPTEL